jgi:hypothetical protein
MSKPSLTALSQEETKDVSPQVDQPIALHVCSMCGQAFPSSWAHGGHKSKSHPGSSLDYTTKAETRRLRIPDRLLHKDAKAKFEQENPGVPSNRAQLA